jgi:hypothetical protein
MTKWELGQDLIAIADYINEKEVDMMKDGHARLANQLKIIRLQVGELFNDNNDHGFLIPDSSEAR